jgi:hypothetical protein
MDYEEEEQARGEEKVIWQVDKSDTNDVVCVDLQGERENHAYTILQNRVFSHTRDFESTLQKRIGMDSEFAHIWHALVWEEFVSISEQGHSPLTIQFLCPLREEATGIKFQFFRVEYELSWKDLCCHLGFSHCCVLSLSKACKGFIHGAFWNEISGLVVSGKFAPRCNDIEHPTLRSMHKWITVTLFPREDVQPVRHR